MLNMRLSAITDADSASYRPYINTGGPLDITNGKFVPTVDGGHVLSGGLGLTTAYIATGNKFKSTLQNSSSVNALARFPYSDLVIDDTEYAAIDKTRLANFSDLYLDDEVKRAAHITDLEDRITIFDPTMEKADSLDAFIDYLKEIRDEKVRRYKDIEVETEILNPETGKPYRMMLPTFANIDSWTEAHVKQLNIRNEEFTADTEMSKQRTIFMEEGLKKATLMRQLPSICAKGGIYLSMTGHVGKKFSIDGKPVAKDLQFMGQDETVKAMGPKFYFLMSSIFKIGSTQPLVDKADRRESEYPSKDHIAGNELLELSISLARAKNGASGNQTLIVASQRRGILTGLSYYNYLKDRKYFGLGSPNKVRSPLLGEMNLGRTKIYDAISDYKTHRAMELVYQLCYIQHNWSLGTQPVDYSISVEKFAEALLAGNGYSIDDILNSRGWWTYKDAPVDRHYLTLPDILAIINGSYVPKFFAVTSGK